MEKTKVSCLKIALAGAAACILAAGCTVMQAHAASIPKSTKSPEAYRKIYVTKKDKASVTPFKATMIKRAKKLSPYVNGIDVSAWQGNVNWAKVKAAGYKFAIIKIGGTYGKTAYTPYTDSKMAANINGAYAAGLKVGVYYWSEARTTSEAKAEASRAVSLVSPYKSKISLPIVMDYEFASGYRSSNYYNSLKASKGVTAARKNSDTVISTWMDTIKANGYTPMFYSYRAMVDPSFNSGARIDAKTLDDNYLFWLAQYSSSNSYTGKYEMWQYTSSGSVPGISGRVDLNHWYTSDVNKFAGESKPADYDETTSASVDAVTPQSVSLSWEKASGATKYLVQRKVSGESYETIDTVTGLSYTDKAVKEGTKYWYRVIPCKGSDKGTASRSVSAVIPESYKGKVSGLKATSSEEGTAETLSWNKADGATEYLVTLYEEDGSTEWTVSDTEKVIFTDPGTSYTASVTPIKSGVAGIKTEITFKTNTPSYSEMVKNLRVNKRTRDYVSIAWNKTDGADKYYVYASDEKNGDYTKIGTRKGTAFTDKNMVRGAGRWYKVAPVKDGIEGRMSDPLLAFSENAFSVRDAKGTVMAGKIDGVYVDAAGDSGTKPYTKSAVCTGNYNLRKTAPSGDRVVTLYKGIKVTVLRGKNTNSGYWYQVKATKSGKTYTGWIVSDGIEPEE